MNTLILPKKLEDNLTLRWATPADNDQLVELGLSCP